MPELYPESPAELSGLVADAVRERVPLAIRGLGTKASLGRPVEVARILDVSRLTGVTFYEPADLVLSARAGTPIAEIDAILATKGQELAFEPMSFAALYGTGPGTIGGAYMTNLSGPRRIKAGALRDFVLGVAAVNGRAEIFKAGGRVVKNVTGYDLARGLAGSFGTLAIATEITLKVLPRAETSATLLVPGLDPGTGVAMLCTAMGLPVDVSGAAHLPLFAARRVGFATAVTALRLEGFAASVAARFDRLVACLASVGRGEKLEAEASNELWRAIRDVTPLAEPRDTIIWKVSVPPEASPRIAEAIARVHPCETLYDWSGGLVWLALAPCPGAGAKTIREAIARNGGGHATLVRAGYETRSEIPVLEPQAPMLAALTQRLKAQFDPYDILEPGRLWAEV